jgi:large conductance mechanosensitive channel
LSGEGTFDSVTAAREAWASVFAYGLFINAIIAFLLVALALFFVIKGINNIKKEKPVDNTPSGPTELDVLQEIRDTLNKK